MYDLTLTCPRCGQSYTGSHVCPELYKSDYDRGFDAGRASVGGYIPPLTKTCPTCGISYTGTHICLQTFKSDYDRGYDAGRAAARRQLGLPCNVGGFEYSRG